MKVRLSAFADEASQNFREQISVLTKENIPLIELRGLDGKNISEIDEKAAREYKKMLDDGGISVWSIGSPLGKTEIDCDFGKYLDVCKHTYALANVFGTDKIRVFSFFGTDREKDGGKVFEKLSEMARCAGEYGVTLYHENEKEIYGDTPERVLKILDNVEGMRSVFDPANYVQCDVDAGSALDLLRERTDYYHIKDALKGSGAVVPAGEGDGQLDNLIKGLDRDTVLTLEPHLILFDGYGNIDRTQLRGKYDFKDGKEAFSAAATALRALLKKNSFKEEGATWIK